VGTVVWIDTVGVICIGLCSTVAVAEVGGDGEVIWVSECQI